MFRFLSGIIIFSLFSVTIFATDDAYVGESLGIHFYTQIDAGRANMRSQIIEKRLTEWHDANAFIQSCLLDDKKIFRDGVTITGEDIDALANGDLTKIHGKIRDDLLKSGNYTTDELTRMQSCILAKYNAIRTDTDTTLKNIEKTSMIGLYTDGSTENSEYDIVADIEKINAILFETPEIYNGTANLGNVAFSDILAGRGTSLFDAETDGSGSTASGTTDEETASGTLTFAGICDASGNLLSDPALLTDIENTLLSGNQNGSSNSGGILSSGSTSTDGENTLDFSHKFPCDSFFCIDVSFRNDSYNVLQGGTPTSIEGIIAKNLEHIEYANATSLMPKYMTNNFFGFTFPFLDLPSLANIVVITSEKPQKFYTLAKDQKRDDELTFDDSLRCARIRAGLSEDETRENDFTSSAYEESVGISHLEMLTTDETTNNTTPSNRLTELGCVEENTLAGSANTYESLSRDLSEIEVFTKSLTSGLQSTVPGVLEKLMNTDRI